MISKSQMLDNFEKNIKKHFESYDFLKFYLTKDDEVSYNILKIRSIFGETEIEIEIHYHWDGFMYDNGDIVNYDDIWRILHIKSMTQYQLARNMLMKNIEKGN